MEKMILKEPSIEYESQLYEYIEEHEKYNSHMNGSAGLSNYYNNIEGYLKRVEEEKAGIYYKNGIPALTYMLIREEDNKLIGMINIRLKLSENLKRCGGHIGYGIRPTERQKGYNKINLYLGLKICSEYGINEVLLDCNKDNIASSKTMIALGGNKISEYYDEKYGVCEKYKINTMESLNKYKDMYDQEKRIKR